MSNSPRPASWRPAWMPTEDAQSTFSRGSWAIAAWAFFLGTSWTWVIGMCWPSILWRDLGLAGYLVFAIPNIIGAAAMGWVLKKPQWARNIAQNHRTMVLVFSAITLAFHAYVAGWLLPAAAGGNSLILLAAAFIIAILFGLKDKGALLWSSIVAAVSLTLILICMKDVDTGFFQGVISPESHTPVS